MVWTHSIKPVPHNSSHQSWTSKAKLVAVPARAEFNQQQMESNPKGFPLLPESPTSTGACLFSPHSHFKSTPSISCKAGALLIPTGGQYGSRPPARPPPACVEQDPSTNVFSYGNDHILIEAEIKIHQTEHRSETDLSYVQCIITLPCKNKNK